MSGVMTTGDRADSFVRREQLWRQLQILFREARPTTAQLEQITGIASVALGVVFESWQIPAEARGDASPQTQLAIDAAECASLYGWALGYARAKQEMGG